MLLDQPDFLFSLGAVLLLSVCRTNGQNYQVDLVLPYSNISVKCNYIENDLTINSSSTNWSDNKSCLGGYKSGVTGIYKEYSNIISSITTFLPKKVLGLDLLFKNLSKYFQWD